MTSGAETLFPLLNNDFVRFGRSGSQNQQLDSSFAGYATYRIVSSSAGDIGNVYSSLYLTPTLTGSFTSDVPQDLQNFRIFRRVPDETKVTVSPIPAYLQNGILVPSNFNPNVDPVALARKVGLIT